MYVVSVEVELVIRINLTGEKLSIADDPTLPVSHIIQFTPSLEAYTAAFPAVGTICTVYPSIIKSIGIISDSFIPVTVPDTHTFAPEFSYTTVLILSPYRVTAGDTDIIPFTNRVIVPSSLVPITSYVNGTGVL